MRHALVRRRGGGAALVSAVTNPGKLPAEYRFQRATVIRCSPSFARFYTWFTR